MTTSERRQIQEWIKIAKRRGWTVRLNAGHYKWYRPNGTYACTTSSTPGAGNRALDNIRTKLRRNGLPIP